jgi:hypothetical protein
LSPLPLTSTLSANAALVASRLASVAANVSDNLMPYNSYLSTLDLASF